MEPADPPWSFLIGGIAWGAAGWWLRRRPAGLDAAFRLLAAGPPRDAERRVLPLALAGAGAAWVLVFAAEAFPYPHGQRPAFVPALVLLLLAASFAALAAAALWVAWLRRR